MTRRKAGRAVPRLVRDGLTPVKPPSPWAGNELPWVVPRPTVTAPGEGAGDDERRRTATRRDADDLRRRTRVRGGALHGVARLLPPRPGERRDRRAHPRGRRAARVPEEPVGPGGPRQQDVDDRPGGVRRHQPGVLP